MLRQLAGTLTDSLIYELRTRSLVECLIYDFRSQFDFFVLTMTVFLPSFFLCPTVAVIVLFILVKSNDIHTMLPVCPHNSLRYKIKHHCEVFAMRLYGIQLKMSLVKLQIMPLKSWNSSIFTMFSKMPSRPLASLPHFIFSLISPDWLRSITTWCLSNMVSNYADVIKYIFIGIFEIFFFTTDNGFIGYNVSM